MIVREMFDQRGLHRADKINADQLHRDQNEQHIYNDQLDLDRSEKR